ncbi:MAG TPA: GntR family transcriptional regulator [Sediminispirochaeta sp.]|nr:GntR family transcriptional regulator [Sediminispirochaeta sp.]
MAPKKAEELQFSIDPNSGVPFYKQIILQIEMAIADRRLKRGNQLPTVRSLAVDLKINPNTVAKAYNQLELRGIVSTQQGTGTFISDKEVEMDDVEREKILSQITRDFLSKASSYGFSIQEIIEHLNELQDRE